MTAIDKAREVADKIKSEVKAKQDQEKIEPESRLTLKVEGHTSMAQFNKNVDILGFDGIPTSIIPIPFYKLVQPGSTNVTNTKGVDAASGSFLMKDNGEEVTGLRIAILRAKRQIRDFTGDDGKLKRTTRIGLLGVNLERDSLFILGINISSFSNFGKMLQQFKEKKAGYSWDFPVILTTVKKEEMKLVQGQMKPTKYWVISFEVEQESFNLEEKTKFVELYKESAASLDWRGQEEEPEVDIYEEAKRIFEEPPMPNVE